jgi:hypothetical protein
MLPDSMTRRIRGIALSALACLALSNHAIGDVIISTQSVDAATRLKRTQRTILSGALVRTEERGKASIVRSELGKIWELSANGSSCVEYTVADLAMLRRGTAEGIRQMLESLAGSASTPQAQALLGQMTSQSSVASPKASYRRLASGETMGKWTCDRFAKEIGGTKVSEVCVVRLAALKLTRSDLAGLVNASAVFGAAPSTWDQETVSLLENTQVIGYDAFPVSISVVDGSGATRFVSHLSGLARSKIPMKAFQPAVNCTPAATVITK